MYRLVSFDQCIHPYNHYPNQDIKYFHHPRKHNILILPNINKAVNCGNGNAFVFQNRSSNLTGEKKVVG